MRGGDRELLQKYLVQTDQKPPGLLQADLHRLCHSFQVVLIQPKFDCRQKLINQPPSESKANPELTGSGQLWDHREGDKWHHLFMVRVGTGQWKCQGMRVSYCAHFCVLISLPAAYQGDKSIERHQLLLLEMLVLLPMPC